ncbi:MAG: hypothetical protein HC836_16775 [Richelia sp. RM2_1_2]|nr:hypothetical protein [Richelia sp. RM2_1_2]
MRYLELIQEDFIPEFWGSWVDTVRREVHPVNTAEHAIFIKNMYPKLKQLMDIKALSVAMGNGWVRLSHDPDDNGVIGMTGLPEPLKIAWSLIKKDVLREFSMLHVNTLKPENSDWRVTSNGNRSFDILTKKQEIISFFNNL